MARIIRVAVTLCLLATTLVTAAEVAAAAPPESAGTPYPDMCLPGSTHPDCPPPRVPPPPSPRPPPTAAPEAGPQPGPNTPPPAPSPPPGPGPNADPDAEGAVPDQDQESSGWVSGAIESFFRDLVTPGLNSLLDLMAESILVTPELDQVPVMGEIWGTSHHLMLAVYGTIVLAAGLIVMCHETLHTRQSIKVVLPRIIVGFLSAAMSLFFSVHAIKISNAVSRSILGEHLDPRQVGEMLTRSLMSSLLNGTLLVVFLALAVLVMLIVVLLTYVIRVALTVILIAAAPLMLMCHALPATEGIAFTWWKAMGGVLVIQIGQSLALVTVIRLFFWPGGVPLFS